MENGNPVGSKYQFGICEMCGNVDRLFRGDLCFTCREDWRDLYDTDVQNLNTGREASDPVIFPSKSFSDEFYKFKRMTDRPEPCRAGKN